MNAHDQEPLPAAELLALVGRPRTGTTGSRRRTCKAKAASDKDLLVIGGRTLWNGLLAAGLVDELHLMVGSVVLGGGEAAFAAGVPQTFTLMGERRFARSQNVLLQYACGGSR